MFDQDVVETISPKVFEFSDLFLEPEGVYYKISPTDNARRVLDDAGLRETIPDLRDRLQKHHTGKDFRTRWNDNNFRVQRLFTTGGDVYVCRLLLPAPIPFADIGFSQRLRKTLLDEAFTKSGLILWTGGAGDGKSMSQYSWLVERLKKHGGTAWTLENPVEIDIRGAHRGPGGVEGTVYQMELKKDVEFEERIEELYRAAPNVMMLGELRTAEATAQAVLAASTGRVVSATIHANNTALALQRVMNLLTAAKVDPSLLGDCLLAVIHQRMKTMTFGKRVVREITVEPLVIATAKSATGLRTNIRNRDFAALTSEIDRQAIVLGDDNVGGIL
ncbi:ATPase, T2SS/T4P/T4SS family [Paraburkholderia youngii]|uniref:ATPase, T2SS/T4P/T4SS family n=1 Tax=Paraburkholderia youngii TaxID=2782701 RepID=UPI003D258F27